MIHFKCFIFLLSLFSLLLLGIIFTWSSSLNGSVDWIQRKREKKHFLSNNILVTIHGKSNTWDIFWIKVLLDWWDLLYQLNSYNDYHVKPDCGWAYSFLAHKIYAQALPLSKHLPGKNSKKMINIFISSVSFSSFYPLLKLQGFVWSKYKHESWSFNGKQPRI